MTREEMIQKVNETVIDKVAGMTNPVDRIASIAKVEMITRVLGFEKDLIEKAGMQKAEAVSTVFSCIAQIIQMYIPTICALPKKDMDILIDSVAEVMNDQILETKNQLDDFYTKSGVK